MSNSTSSDGIILLAKTPGLTSFSSLGSIKRALGTTKVGHTGTLDSFAQGLLVVCTGRLTRLAGCITEFDKSYKAVIKFGEETDTLEYTGEVIRTASLPTPETLNKALEKFKGNILQAPPAFSAVHVNGKRASDLAREGKTVELPPRPVTVFDSQIEETKLTEDGLVEYARIIFSVSKGTYIRCLARDIGKECGSAAHLVGLYRTKVGNFKIEDAAGFGALPQFTINSALSQMNQEKNDAPEAKEIIEKKRGFDRKTALLCGFTLLTLSSDQAEKDFCNGKPLRSALFGTDLHAIAPDTLLAVFSQNGTFRGLIEKESGGRLRHRFVINV